LPLTTSLCIPDGRYRHFDTIEIIASESQNTHTEQYFQDAIEKWQKLWERYVCAEGDYLKGDFGQYTKSQMAAPVLVIIDSSSNTHYTRL
jgi:hypothetical protein